jgi:hypothetical protein
MINIALILALIIFIHFDLSCEANIYKMRNFYFIFFISLPFD